MKRFLILAFLLILVSCGSDSSKESKVTDGNAVITDSTINSQLSGFEKKDNEISYLNDFEKSSEKFKPLITPVAEPKTDDQKSGITGSKVVSGKKPSKNDTNSSSKFGGLTVDKQKSRFEDKGTFKQIFYSISGTCDSKKTLYLEIYIRSEVGSRKIIGSGIPCEDGKYKRDHMMIEKADGPYSVDYMFTIDGDIYYSGSSGEIKSA